MSLFQSLTRAGSPWSAEGIAMSIAAQLQKRLEVIPGHKGKAIICLTTTADYMHYSQKYTQNALCVLFNTFLF